MKTQTAFSLIEVLIVLVIIIILASVALPNLQNFVIQNRITAKTNELVKTLNYARTESISHPNVVFSVTPLEGEEGDWNKGWQFLREAQVVKIFESKNDRITLTSINNPAVTRIDYTGRGRVRMPPGNNAPFQFQICSEERQKYPNGQQITIAFTGRISSQRIQCN